MMLKKLLSLFLIMLFLAVPSAMAAEEDAHLVLLSALDILNGYEDGSYRLENPLTRAEFTKLAVAASNDRKKVAGTKNTSPFYDVPHTHWAAPYIVLASAGGYVNGYLDASFRPENQVTYAEAVAVCLRLLGYENTDFGAVWPDGHMEIAREEGLCEHIAATPDDILLRRDAAMLFYNLLNVRQKNGTADYVDALSIKRYENMILMADAKTDSSIPQNKVLTGAGTFKKGLRYNDAWLGRQGDLYIEDGNTVLAFVPKPQTEKTYLVTGTAGEDLLLDGTVYDMESAMPVYYQSATLSYANVYTKAVRGQTFTLYLDKDGTAEYGVLKDGADAEPLAAKMETYAVYAALKDGIITYQNGEMKKIQIDDGLPLYKDDKPAGNLVKAQLSMGDILKIRYKEDGTASYAVLDDKGVEGPYTVLSEEWQKHVPQNDTTIIMRDGKRITTDEIEKYDVLYYSESLNMLLVYHKKVTGVYQDATPSKDAPTSVTVSGKTYTLESLAAFHALATGGTASFGDTVTLLLGRNDEVADVIVDADFLTEQTGVLIGTGTKAYENREGKHYTGYYLSVVGADGQTNEYEATQNYEMLINQVVTLSFEDGKVSASAARGAAVHGTVDALRGTIGTYAFSPDVEILDVYIPADNMPANVGSVFLKRLDGVEIYAGSVLYAARDKKDRITKLFLKDVTGDLHRYGVVIKAVSGTMDKNLNGSYTYTIGGAEETLRTNGKTFSVGANTPAQFTQSGGSIYSIKRLSPLREAITAYTENMLWTTNGASYDITDADIYWCKEPGEYTVLPKDTVDLKAYTLSAYYDKTPKAGGKIRVILATKKGSV